MRCNQKYNTYCVFAHVAKNNVTKKRAFRPHGKPFLFQHVSPTATKNANHRFASPSQPKRQKTRTRFVNNVARKTFPVLSIVAVRIFSQQKHEAVRCVQSSGVSPAALRRCKTAYPCAYSRNKAKKRFVLVQRFMPAYALCRHIIKLYKNQYGRGQALAWCECAYFLAAKARNGALCAAK